MGKKTVPPAGREAGAGQSKITGFFQKPKKPLTELSPEKSKNVSENNKIHTESVIASPEVKRKLLDEEVFDKTPEINPNKRKSKIRLRKTLDTKNGDKMSENKFKRKLDNEEMPPMSPVFKKKRSDEDLSIVHKEEVKKIMVDEYVVDAEKRKVGQEAKECEDSKAIPRSPEAVAVKPLSEGAANWPRSPPLAEEEEDLWACCLDDSPFKLPPEAEEEPEAAEQPAGTRLGRHTVRSVRPGPGGALELELDSWHAPRPRQRTARLLHSWAATRLLPGDLVHVEADWDPVTGHAVIDDQQGTVVVEPDFLVSSTTVVSGLFCLRKAVLAEKFKGLEGGSRVMLLGTVVHELMQEVLRHETFKRPEILRQLDAVLAAPRILADMAGLGISQGDMRAEAEPFVRHIQYFADRFLLGRQVTNTNTN